MTISGPKPTYGKRALFFDRDGVLNDTVDRGDNFFVQGKKVRWTAPFNYGEFHLRSGVSELLEEAGRLGFLRILVTNQPDVTYGTMSVEEYERIMAEVKKLPFDDIYVCTHGRDDGCLCKKPLPGMLLTAAGKWGIDLNTSYMIGDTKIDTEAAKAAGCVSILLEDGRNSGITADRRAADFSELIRLVQE